jgi:hypothetical protein
MNIHNYEKTSFSGVLDRFGILSEVSFGTWIAQFLDGTSGWPGVTITKFFTIKSSLFRWLF